MPDRGYAILLRHLHTEKPAVGLQTIQAALAHHLANLSPLPTPLAATIVSSPFYLSQPFSLEQLQSLATAFRHALHFKIQLAEKLSEAQSTMVAIFSRNPQATVTQWIVDVNTGLQGGQPVIRLACLTGLLIGIEDVEKTKRQQHHAFDVGRGRAAVENELVITVAEIVDSHGVEPKSEWEKEFRPVLADSETLCLSLILASQCLPLVSRTRLKALPLSVINGMLVSTIRQAFCSGAFMSPLAGLSTSSTSGPLQIPDLKALASSTAYASMALLSKLTALTLDLMLDTRSQRVQHAMETAFAALSTFKRMAEVVESDWASNPLPGRRSEDIDVQSREISKDLWSTLKTFLFSTVMVSQAALTPIVYVPPGLFAPSRRPTHLALEILETLCHLSFVVSEFGGVTADSNSFGELKRVTYLALDILSQEPKGAELFAKSVHASLDIDGSAQTYGTNLPSQVQRQKKAFALACLEQLVPVVSIDCLRDCVWEMAYPHLSDSSHQETYESAHSVVLAMLASHAASETSDVLEQSESIDASNIAFPSNFVTRIIPFYAQCLIENSGVDKLSTTQLQQAYSALVRSAAASSAINARNSVALAWYCVDTLLEAIRDVEETGGNRKEEQAEHDNYDRDSHLHRLRLTLITTVPSLPSSLMLPILDKIRDLFLESSGDNADSDYSRRDRISHEQKAEFVNTLFKEILEKLGEREKEAAMRWWYANLGYLDIYPPKAPADHTRVTPQVGAATDSWHEMR